MTDFGICDALSEKLGTYGAGGGGVALVVCRHAFHWVLLSHLQQKKTGQMEGVCRCWNSTTGTNSSSSSLPADRVEHVFCTQSKSEKVNSVYTGPMPHYL